MPLMMRVERCKFVAHGHLRTLRHLSELDFEEAHNAGHVARAGRLVPLGLECEEFYVDTDSRHVGDVDGLHFDSYFPSRWLNRS
jgi:hypothetical protein